MASYLQELRKMISQLTALADEYERHSRLPNIYGLVLEDYSDPLELARFRAAVYHSPRLEKFAAVVEWLPTENGEADSHEVEAWCETQDEAMEQANKAAQYECKLSAQNQDKGTIPFQMV